MNRKKISIKGALLALAVSVPSLISTAVFTAPMQQSINQSNGLIDNSKTFTSLSEPYNQNLSIDTMFDAPSVSISINKAFSLSFVDSTSDRNYPHASDSDVYINKNHDPKRREMQYSPTITFAEIDVKKMFNLNSIDDFFLLYNLNFWFTYSLNTWTNNSGWNHPGGKQLFPEFDQAIWTGSNDNFKGWHLGDLDSGRKAYANAQVFMLYTSPTVIKVQGNTISAFNWLNGSLVHHAAYALLQGVSLKAELKILS